MKKTVLALLFGFVAISSGLCQAEDAPRKIIGVLIYDKVLTSDVTVPLEVFGRAAKMKEFAGYQVIAIAPEKKPVTTDEGKFTLTLHHLLSTLCFLQMQKMQTL